MTAAEPSHGFLRSADAPTLGPVQGSTDSEARQAYISFLEAELSRVTGPHSVAPPARLSARAIDIANRLSRMRASRAPDGPADNELSSVEEDLYFRLADTRVAITNSGAHSSADVVAYSELNRASLISHDIEIKLSTSSGTTTFPKVHHSTGIWRHTSLITPTPFRGVNCTVNSQLSAWTSHQAGGLLERNISAFSMDFAACAGDEYCEPSDEPPTAVAPGPYDPGAGEGSDGTTGDCQGTGGTTPPGSNCHDEYVYVERSTDGGVTWTVIWEGWTIVCT
jgi:hypothetical protein